MFGIPRSFLTAGTILLVLLLYFGIRSVTRTETSADSEPASISAAEASEREVAKPNVVVRSVSAETRAVKLNLKGQTEPVRTVTVRAETTGTVIRANAKEGAIVSRGTVLCSLDLDAREARKNEAEAAVKAAQLDFEANQSLAEKGLASTNRTASAKAALDGAQAALASARIEIGKTKLRAPFEGVFESRTAELGDFLAPGAACGTIVDLDPILIVVEATEAQIKALKPGNPAQIELIDGRSMDGEIRFVARTADRQTRTYRVEVEAPNEDFSIAAGLTASVKISAGEAEGIRLTPATLVLHDDGRVGVRYVDSDNFVRFTPVTIIDDDLSGIWVTGVPEGARLLTAGQDYLRAGVEVIPTPAEGL